jgi:hypothetical protein
LLLILSRDRRKTYECTVATAGIGPAAVGSIDDLPDFENIAHAQACFKRASEAHGLEHYRPVKRDDSLRRTTSRGGTDSPADCDTIPALIKTKAFAGMLLLGGSPLF